MHNTNTLQNTRLQGCLWNHTDLKPGVKCTAVTMPLLLPGTGSVCPTLLSEAKPTTGLSPSYLMSNFTVLSKDSVLRVGAAYQLT